MNLSCVNRFPPFFFFFSPSSSSVDVSLVLQDHLSRILSSLLLHQIPPMLLGELSVSRICQSEPYSRGIAAFSPFDPFDPSSYSLSSLILAIHVFSWTWDTWVVILLDGSRVWDFFTVCWSFTVVDWGIETRRVYIISIYTRQFLVNSFWQGNVEWCTELQWSSFEMIRKDKYITQEIKLS